MKGRLQNEVMTLKTRTKGNTTMKRMLLISMTGLSLYSGLPAAASIDAGKQAASAVCASCHGMTGISASDAFPNLAGQKAGYLVSALKAYRVGSRKAPIMNNMAAGLGDQAIDDLAAYFASLKPVP
jgi:cytochrome c553